MIGDLFQKILKRAEAVPLQSEVVTDPALYRARLNAVLDDWTEDAADRLACALGALPVKAERVDLGVHLSLDAEGFVSVMVHVAGRDSHVLNRAVHEFRDLFTVRSTPDGLVPPVPSVNPREQDFPTNQIAYEVASAWALKVWMRSGGPETEKGGMIFCDPDCGDSDPVRLP